MDYNLTEGSVRKKLLAFAVPILGANLLQAMYGTVDLIVVGRFADASAVSAVSTGSMTMHTITGIIAGLTMGCTVLLGHNIGKRDNQAAARTVASSVALFALIGAVLSVLILLTAEPIARVMNAPEEALAQTVSYIRICGGGILCIVFFNALSGMMRGIGDSGTPLALMSIACVCNIVGDLILVKGFGMGSAGAAIATVAAQGFSVLCAYAIIHRRGFGFEMDRGDLRPASVQVRQILKYGVPIAAQDALTGVSFMVILAILNGFGLVASAGVGVGEKICSLMFIVPGAIMAAVSAFSAQNVGAGRRERAKEAMFMGMGITVTIGLVVFAVSFFRGEWLAGFFTTDTAVMEAAADYLRSYSVDCVIVGFNFNMMGYLNGNGKTGFVALQGILSTFLVRIPVSYFMSKIPGVSLFQVGLATPLATVFAIILTTIYLIHMEKEQNALTVQL